MNRRLILWITIACLVNGLARASNDDLNRCVQRAGLSDLISFTHAEYAELRSAARGRASQPPDTSLASALKNFRKAQDDLRNLHAVDAEEKIQLKLLTEKLVGRGDELARITNQHVDHGSGIKYEVLPMDRHYVAEVRKAVSYLSDQLRTASKLTIKNGRFYDAEGKLFDTTKAYSTNRPLPGQLPMAIFVMDERGNFYATNFYLKDWMHHSSLVQGRPVAFAGEMGVLNGELKRLGDRSGHYWLPPPFRRQVLRELLSKHIDLKKIEYQFEDAAEMIARPAPDRPDANEWDDRLAAAGAFEMLAEFEIYKRRAPAIYRARLEYQRAEEARFMRVLAAAARRPDIKKASTPEIEALLKELNHRYRYGAPE